MSVAVRRAPGVGRSAARLAVALAFAVTGVRAAPVDVRVLDAQGQPVAQAVVFLESAAARAAVRAATGVEIAQDRRRFEPMVSVVPVGSAVAFPNRDTVRHHVYSFSPAKTFELKLYIGRPANPVVFDRAGIAVLGCNIHDEMIAWVVVVETPWYAMTDAGGTARIDAPPGPHRLRVWHPDLPPGAPALDEAVQVAAAGHAVTVRLPAPGAGR